MAKSTKRLFQGVFRMNAVTCYDTCTQFSDCRKCHFFKAIVAYEFGDYAQLLCNRSATSPGDAPDPAGRCGIAAVVLNFCARVATPPALFVAPWKPVAMDATGTRIVRLAQIFRVNVIGDLKLQTLQILSRGLSTNPSTPEVSCDLAVYINREHIGSKKLEFDSHWHISMFLLQVTTRRGDAVVRVETSRKRSFPLIPWRIRKTQIYGSDKALPAPEMLATA